MKEKISTAVTEFHKWLTLIGFPFMIGLQLTILSKVEANTIKISEHEITIKYHSFDIAELKDGVKLIFQNRFKQTTEESK